MFLDQWLMINKERIEKLVENAIKELATEVYVADILIKSDNRIYVFLDSDTYVHIEDCIVISKHIESQIDRESEDFELNVSSYGATQPLKFPRQYIKNIGRNLEIIKQDDTEAIGEITAANDNGIVLLVTPKKKKETPISMELSYNEIKEAKIMISFK